MSGLGAADERNVHRWSGRLLGSRYRLGMSIGRGGMGSVFEAEDERMGRQVAVKVLHPHLARERTYVERFRLEAETTGRLLHPHIVEVLDAGEDGGLWFLVMEFLPGASLRALVRQHGALSPPQVVRLTRQALSGIAAAHEAQVVHRDLKPANLLVVAGSDGGRAKIVDFGIATLWSTAGYVRLTATGEIIGTPEYMAPEQLRSGPIGPRLDLYGMGLIMYYALAGRTPFRNDGDELHPIQRVLLNRYPPLNELRPDLPLALCDVVHRALAARPEERYESATAMARALAEIEPQVLEVERTVPGRPAHAAPAKEPSTVAARPGSRRAPTDAPQAAPTPEPETNPEPETGETALQEVWPAGVPPRRTLDLIPDGSPPDAGQPPDAASDEPHEEEPTLPH